MKNYGSISLDHRGNPVDHRRGNPHPQDHLVPPFFSSSQDEEANSTTTSNSERPSSLLVGTFNLIATILGGGVLTLPIAFQKCGVAFTSLFMLVSAYMTYMSLMMLCYSSRRSGASRCVSNFITYYFSEYDTPILRFTILIQFWRGCTFCLWRKSGSRREFDTLRLYLLCSCCVYGPYSRYLDTIGWNVLG